MSIRVINGGLMQLDTAYATIEDFYRRIYWQAPPATTHYTQPFTLSYCGITWQHSLNQLWLHDKDYLSDILLHQTDKFFARFDAEYSILFADTPGSETAQWLIERHFTERSISPIYTLRGLPRPKFTHRETRIVRADVNQQQDILSILYNAFFMGPETGRSVVRPEHFTDHTIRHYLAYIDNEAAACCTLMLHNGIAGIWNVGTLRMYRRQGIAAALLMQALVEAAEDGYPDSVLVASPMGKTLYEEMGYECIGMLYCYGLAE